MLGAGGHGMEVVVYLGDLAASGHPIEAAGILDENSALRRFEGAVPVVGSISDIVRISRERAARYYITAFGDNRLRKRIVERVEELTAASLIPYRVVHPTAVLGTCIDIGEGSCIAPGCVLTTRVRIGRHCILNVRSSVSHDSEIGDFANINPGATVCGCVKIGDGAYIGASATVIDHVSVGEWSVIGAGAVVIHDIPPHVTAVGVPAKIVRQH